MNSIFDINLQGIPSWVVIENVRVPKGVLSLIFSYLTAEELKNCFFTCKPLFKCILQSERFSKISKLNLSLEKPFQKINSIFNQAIFDMNNSVVLDIENEKLELADSNESLIEKIKIFYHYPCPLLFDANPNDLCEEKTLQIHTIECSSDNYIEIRTTIKDKEYAKANLEKNKWTTRLEHYKNSTYILEPQTYHIVLLKKSFLKSQNQKYENVLDCKNWLAFSTYYDKLIPPINETSITILDKKIATKTKKIEMTVKSFPREANFILPDSLIYKIQTIITETVLKRIEEKEKAVSPKEKCIIN